MKCSICQRETSRGDTMGVALGYGMKVCTGCDDWLLTLKREVSNVDRIFPPGSCVTDHTMGDLQETMHRIAYERGELDED